MNPQNRSAKTQNRSNTGSVSRTNLSTEKPKNFKKTFGQIMKVFIKPNKLSMIFVVLLTILSTIFAIVSPKILGNMTNQIVDDFISVKIYDNVHNNLPEGVTLLKDTTLHDLPGVIENAAKTGQIRPEVLQELATKTDEMNADEMINSIPAAQRDLVENLDLSEKPVFHYEKLAKIGIFLVSLYIIATLASYLSGWISSGVIMRTSRKLRQDISEKINRMPIKYFDKTPYGDTLSRITNDVDTIGQTLGQSFSQSISAVIMIVGVLAMMLSINWLLTLVAVAVIIVSFISVTFVTKASQKHFKNVQDQLGDLNGYVEENYAGQLIIKSFSAEKRKNKDFQKLTYKLFNSSWRSQFYSGLMMPIMNFIGNLGYVATAVIGGWMALNGRLSIGDIQAFIQYVSQMQQPISQIGQIASMFQSTVAAAERVFTFLEEPEEIDTIKDGNKIYDENNLKIEGGVEFKNVGFSYEPGKKVINNFTAKVKPGQKVAIVGHTGAGKTTIVNLLMRFYDPDKGQILVDGIDTKDLSRDSVRDMFSMVLQDTWLFEGTIYENLAYGDLEADHEHIKKAAEVAYVDHFVRSLPDGYDTKIGENSDNISVGERQLLTIARAMIADAPMLILDEATSDVDTRTEVLIQKAMNKLMHGRTSFVIAHRLSTIKDADLIFVMKNGNIIEQGNHKQLLENDGYYAQLYNSQFSE